MHNPPGGYGAPPGGGFGQPPGGRQGWGQPPAAPYGAPSGYGVAPAYGGPPPPPPKKASLTWLWILLGVVVAGFGGCGVCIALLPEEDPAVIEKRVEERRDTIQATEDRLKKLVKAFPDVDGLEDKKCKDTDIPKRTSDKPHHVVDYDYIVRFTKGGEAKKHEAGWDFLTASAVRDFKPVSKLDDELDSLTVGNMVSSLDYLEAGRIMVVLRATDAKDLPTLDGDEEFIMGDFQGWAVVFDYVEGKPLCQVKLSVASSEEVSHIEGGLLGESPQEAISKDFQDRFGKKLDAALATISDKLDVSLY